MIITAQERMYTFWRCINKTERPNRSHRIREALQKPTTPIPCIYVLCILSSSPSTPNRNAQCQFCNGRLLHRMLVMCVLWLNPLPFYFSFPPCAHFFFVWLCAAFRSLFSYWRRRCWLFFSLWTVRLISYLHLISVFLTASHFGARSRRRWRCCCCRCRCIC